MSLARDFLSSRLVFTLWELTTGSKTQRKLGDQEQEGEEQSHPEPPRLHNSLRGQESTRIPGKDLGPERSTEPQKELLGKKERATQREGNHLEKEEENQPPRDLVEEELLEHAEDVLLCEEVGDLGEGQGEDHFESLSSE